MDLHRVAVIGTSCSGKTTFARRLAEKLESNHLELDSVYWGPRWRTVPETAFRSAVEDAARKERWVIDGNYRMVREIIWSRATAIAWLNYPFPLVFTRALRRTIGRSLSGKELYSGNRESLRSAFLSRESILLWVIRSHLRQRRLYERTFAGENRPRAEILEFRRPREAESFLSSLGGPEPGGL